MNDKLLKQLTTLLDHNKQMAAQLDVWAERMVIQGPGEFDYIGLSMKKAAALIRRDIRDCEELLAKSDVQRIPQGR